MNKRLGFLSLALLFTVSCTSVNEYPISGSYAKINEKQILDPMAPENNEGIVNNLDGSYGEGVVASYKKASTAPTEGRTSENAESLIKSSNSSGNR
ncbi:hypothetical protein [Thalassotalea crassostreae]|uniref:hypothetical protein n=1 Tax=Thalassotalea crassostreae TaxID=1763536 RepID=UPI0008391BF7|nr:hypothetical protein [Thalassotalea crassostreae]